MDNPNKLAIVEKSKSAEVLKFIQKVSEITAISAITKGTSLRALKAIDVEDNKTSLKLHNAEDHSFEKLVLTTLSFAIKQCADSFNVARNMSDIQIFECALTLLKEPSFNHFKLEEIFYVLRQGKTGKYASREEFGSKVHEKFDASLIYEWLWKYDSTEKEEACYKINLELKYQANKESKGLLSIIGDLAAKEVEGETEKAKADRLALSKTLEEIKGKPVEQQVEQDGAIRPNSVISKKELSYHEVKAQRFIDSLHKGMALCGRIKEKRDSYKNRSFEYMFLNRIIRFNEKNEHSDFKIKNYIREQIVNAQAKQVVDVNAGKKAGYIISQDFLTYLLEL